MSSWALAGSGTAAFKENRCPPSAAPWCSWARLGSSRWRPQWALPLVYGTATTPQPALKQGLITTELVQSRLTTITAILNHPLQRPLGSPPPMITEPVQNTSTTITATIRSRRLPRLPCAQPKLLRPALALAARLSRLRPCPSASRFQQRRR